MSTKSDRTAETSPVRLLLGDYHLRLLALLLLRPAQDFHLREIERLTAVPAGTAARELKRFLEAGLVTRRESGNQVRYQANRGCIVFEELSSMLRKTAGLADVLRDALHPIARKITGAFIFGSAAQGKEGPFSDVDLMIVGTPTFEEVVAVLPQAQLALGRSINPVIFSEADFEARRAVNDGFLARVLAEPSITLIGPPLEPGQPRPHGAAQGARGIAGGSRAAARGGRKKPGGRPA